MQSSVVVHSTQHVVCIVSTHLLLVVYFRPAVAVGVVGGAQAGHSKVHGYLIRLSRVTRPVVLQLLISPSFVGTGALNYQVFQENSINFLW